MKRTKDMAVWEAWQRRERMEAIVENVLRKYGRVSDSLAEQLLSAEIDYAVAKDDLHDRYVEDK
jgi:hypothetical protein